RTGPSPSPLPSPQGRGRKLLPFAFMRGHLGLSREWMRGSLSPRERVGVRGNGSRIIRAGSSPQYASKNWASRSAMVQILPRACRRQKLPAAAGGMPAARWAAGLFALCALGLATTLAKAEDWPQWGGNDPGRNMYSPAKNVPILFNPGKLKSGTEEFD